MCDFAQIAEMSFTWPTQVMPGDLIQSSSSEAFTELGLAGSISPAMSRLMAVPRSCSSRIAATSRPYAFVFEQPTDKGDGWRPCRLGQRLQAFDVNTGAGNERDVTGGNPERKQSVPVVRVLHQRDVFSAHTKEAKQKHNKGFQQSRFNVFGNEGEAETGQRVHAGGAAADGGK